MDTDRDEDLAEGLMCDGKTDMDTKGKAKSGDNYTWQYQMKVSCWNSKAYSC